MGTMSRMMMSDGLQRAENCTGHSRFAAERRNPTSTDPEPDAHEPTDEAVDDARADEPAGRPAKRKGRASVPSWDEIMFGGGKPSE